MKITFLLISCLALAFSCASEQPNQQQIDRRALVERHCPVITFPDSLSPLTVGNGEFAFTADITGLQTFPELYEGGIPLQTQSHWGWHSFPNHAGFRLEDTMEQYNSHGRLVGYPTRLSEKSSPWAAKDSSGASFQPFSMSEERGTAASWLRANPHRLDLGRIGLVMTARDGSPAKIENLRNIDQRLDLWTGIITSRFELDGQPVRVETCCHPERDLVAVRVTSSLAPSGRIGISVRFPYATGAYGKSASDWNSPERHKTVVTGRTENRIDLERALDNDRYFSSIQWEPGGVCDTPEQHRFELRKVRGGETLVAVCAFSSTPFDSALPGADESFAASREHWERFWSTGGAIDLSGSLDPRAGELERRIVLSQYLTAIQCAGSLPPQETGLTFNSWHGKFHLEMHWTHGVHFYQWGRTGLLERSLPYYESILPAARELARRQGYRGARWPKMTDPAGRQSPSHIAPLLVWQQPHPIYFAELMYRQRGDRATLERYRDIVFESAEFMASFLHWEEAHVPGKSGRYVLGPALMTYQESLGGSITNPTFELAYWRWGLETAQRWRERLGLPRDGKWNRILAHLSQPVIIDGKYVAAETVTDTFTNPGRRNDHPSFLAACGMIPGDGIDFEAMRASLLATLKTWNWESTWGNDPPLAAMAAVRLGEPDAAIDLLLGGKPLKFDFLPNGHCFQNSDILPVFLPANGGLLITAAMMAAGWDGAPGGNAPGFPQNGRWKVRWEGIQKIP